MAKLTANIFSDEEIKRRLGTSRLGDINANVAAAKKAAEIKENANKSPEPAKQSAEPLEKSEPSAFKEDTGIKKPEPSAFKEDTGIKKSMDMRTNRIDYITGKKDYLTPLPLSERVEANKNKVRQSISALEKADPQSPEYSNLVDEYERSKYLLNRDYEKYMKEKYGSDFESRTSEYNKVVSEYTDLTNNISEYDNKISALIKVGENGEISGGEVKAALDGAGAAYEKYKAAVDEFNDGGYVTYDQAQIISGLWNEYEQAQNDYNEKSATLLELATQRDNLSKNAAGYSGALSAAEDYALFFGFNPYYGAQDTVAPSDLQKREYEYQTAITELEGSETLIKNMEYAIETGQAKNPILTQAALKEERAKAEQLKAEVERLRAQVEPYRMQSYGLEDSELTKADIERLEYFATKPQLSDAEKEIVKNYRKIIKEEQKQGNKSAALADLDTALKTKIDVGGAVAAGIRTSLTYPDFFRDSIETIAAHATGGEKGRLGQHYKELSQSAIAAYPTAAAVGQMAGEVGKLLAASALTGGALAGAEGYSSLAPWLKSAINRMTARTVVGAYNAVSGGGERIAENIVKESIKGFAGGAVETKALEGLHGIINNMGLQNYIVPDIVASGVANIADAATIAVIDELPKGISAAMRGEAYNLNWESFAREMLIEFGYAAILNLFQSAPQYIEMRKSTEKGIENVQAYFEEQRQRVAKLDLQDPAQLDEAQKIADEISKVNNAIKNGLEQYAAAGALKGADLSKLRAFHVFLDNVDDYFKQSAASATADNTAITGLLGASNKAPVPSGDIISDKLTSGTLTAANPSPASAVKSTDVFPAAVTRAATTTDLTAASGVIGEQPVAEKVKTNVLSSEGNADGAAAEAITAAAGTSKMSTDLKKTADNTSDTSSIAEIEKELTKIADSEPQNAKEQAQQNNAVIKLLVKYIEETEKNIEKAKALEEFENSKSASKKIEKLIENYQQAIGQAKVEIKNRLNGGALASNVKKSVNLHTYHPVAEVPTVDETWSELGKSSNVKKITKKKAAISVDELGEVGITYSVMDSFARASGKNAANAHLIFANVAEIIENATLLEEAEKNNGYAVLATAVTDEQGNTFPVETILKKTGAKKYDLTAIKPNYTNDSRKDKITLERLIKSSADTEIIENLPPASSRGIYNILNGEIKTRIDISRGKLKKNRRDLKNLDKKEGTAQQAERAKLTALKEESENELKNLLEEQNELQKKSLNPERAVKNFVDTLGISSDMATKESATNIKKRLALVARDILSTGQITSKEIRALATYLLDRTSADYSDKESGEKTGQAFAREVLKSVRGLRVYVDPMFKGDFRDYEAFRRRAFGKGLYLTTKPGPWVGIDTLYLQLKSEFGEMFDQEHAAEPEQLKHILDIVDSYKEKAPSILDTFDKKELDRYMEFESATIENAVAELLRSGKIEGEYKKTISGLKAEVERLKRGKLLDTLQNELFTEAKRWRTNSKKASPETKEYYQLSIETLSNKLWNAFDHLTKKIKKDLVLEGTSYENIHDFKIALDEFARVNDGDVYITDTIKEAISNFPNKSVGEIFDPGELAEAISFLRAANSFHYANRLDFEMSKRRQIRDISHAAISEIAAVKGSSRPKSKKKVLSFFQILSPSRAINYLGGFTNGGAHEKLAQSLEEGDADRRRFLIKKEKLNEMFFNGGKDGDKTKSKARKKEVETLKKEVYEFSFKPITGWVESNTFGVSTAIYAAKPINVKVTKGELYSIAFSLRDEKVEENIMTAGMTFKDHKLLKKDERQAISSKDAITARVPKKTLEEMKKKAEESQFYIDYKKEVLEPYFDKLSFDETNEAWLELNGWERLPEGLRGKYAPIYTNSDFTAPGENARYGIIDITDKGELKKREANGQRMVFFEVDQLIEHHAETISRLVGYGNAVQLLKGVLGFRDGELSYKQKLNAKWGAVASKYLEEVANLSASPLKDDSPENKIFKALEGFGIASALGGNVGSVLKQPISYVKALSHIKGKNLAQALKSTAPDKLQSVDDDVIFQYTTEHESRKGSNISRELHYIKTSDSKILKNIRNNKMLNFMLGGAMQAADILTSRRLFFASMYEAKEKFPNLYKVATAEEIKNGTSVFMKKAAEIFDRAIRDTQVTYTDMTTAPILRTKNLLFRQLVLFRGEAYQSFGMLFEAFARKKDRSKTIKIIMLATLFSALVTTGMSILKGNTDTGLDENGELSAKNISGDVLENVVDENLGIVPLFGAGSELARHIAAQVLELFDVDKKITEAIDADFFEPEVMGIGGITKFIENVYKFGKSVKEGNDNAGQMLEKAAISGLDAFGLPARNIRNYLLGTLDKFGLEATAGYKNFFSDLQGKDIKYLYGGIKKSAADRVIKNNIPGASDTAKKELYRLYQKIGVTVLPDNSRKTYNKVQLLGSESGEPESVTIKFSDTERKLYKKVYGDILDKELDGLLNSEFYKKLDDERKAKAVKDMYSYARESALFSAVGIELEGWQKSAAGAVKDGAALAEFIQFKEITSEFISTETKQKTAEAAGQNPDDVEDLGTVAKQKIDYLLSSGFSDTTQEALYFNGVASSSAVEKYNKLKTEGYTNSEIYEYIIETYDIAGDDDGTGGTAKGTKALNIFNEAKNTGLSDNKKVGLYLALTAGENSNIAKIFADNHTAAKSNDIGEYELLTFLVEHGAMTSEKDENGKTIANSLRGKAWAYIDSLDISTAAKDFLHLLKYSANTLSKAPWKKTAAKKSGKSATKALVGRLPGAYTPATAPAATAQGIDGNVFALADTQLSRILHSKEYSTPRTVAARRTKALEYINNIDNLTRKQRDYIAGNVGLSETEIKAAPWNAPAAELTPSLPTFESEAQKIKKAKKGVISIFEELKPKL